MRRDASKSDAREKIITTAMELFNRQGVHHTGNEQIISESGVAKMTFYKHFPTKAKLIAEYLRRRDVRWFDLLNQHVQAKSDPKDKLLGLFEALEAWFSEPDYYGCPFIRGLSDFDESDDPEVTACVGAHFSETGAFILAILKELKIKEPEKLVPHLLSLVAGAIVVSHATKSPAIASVNYATALALVESAKKEG